MSPFQPLSALKLFLLLPFLQLLKARQPVHLCWRKGLPASLMIVDDAWSFPVRSSIS